MCKIYRTASFNDVVLMSLLVTLNILQFLMEDDIKQTTLQKE